MKNRWLELVWLTQSFFDELVLIYPVYAIMMLEHGMDEFDLSLLFAIWALAALLLEIPSGVIGDLVDRRRYSFVGSLAGASGFLCWWVWPDFWGFALGFILWSTGSAIHSGTQQSLLYDALAEQGRAGDFARIYGRGKGLQSLAVLTAVVLGGFAAQSGYQGVLLLSALAPFIAGSLVLGAIREPVRTNLPPDRDLISEAPESPLTAALAALMANPALRLISLMFVFFLGLSGVVDEYLGPLLMQLGNFSLGVIGLLSGLILGSRALGTALAHRLRALPLGRIGLASAGGHFVLLVGLAAGMSSGGLWLVLALCLYFAVLGAVEVLLEANLQHEIDVDARATITSVAGAGLEVWAMVLFLFVGLIARQSDWSTALASMGLVAVALSAWLAWLAGSGRILRRR